MAYTPFPRSKDLLSGTSNYRVSVEFIGADEATEPRFVKELIITPDMTIAQCREWAWIQINNAKPKKSVADQITLGAAVTPLQPAAPAGPTADDIWVAQCRTYQALSNLKTAGIVKTEMDTEIGVLKTAIQNGYTVARGAML